MRECWNDSVVYQHQGTVAVLRVQVALAGKLGAISCGEGDKGENAAHVALGSSLGKSPCAHRSAWRPQA